MFGYKQVCPKYKLSHYDIFYFTMLRCNLFFFSLIRSISLVLAGFDCRSSLSLSLRKKEWCELSRSLLQATTCKTCWIICICFVYALFVYTILTLSSQLGLIAAHHPYTRLYIYILAICLHICLNKYTICVWCHFG